MPKRYGQKMDKILYLILLEEAKKLQTINNHLNFLQAKQYIIKSWKTIEIGPNTYTLL